jgi:hypothetical protein
MLAWLKERWELILGFLVGLVGILALTRGNTNKKVLGAKGDLLESTTDTLEGEHQNFVDAVAQANDSHDSNVDSILTNRDDALEELDQSTKDKIAEMSDKSNVDLAAEIQRIVEQNSRIES